MIENDTITCVAASCTHPSGAAVVTITDAYVFPGFIDAHDHVAYNFLPKWTPPKLYQNRGEWQGSTSYKAFKNPYDELKSVLPCEIVKYGELRALVSGVTTIQGTAPSRTCFRMLVRNAENQNELSLPSSHIRTFILDISSFKSTIDWGVTKAFVVHLSKRGSFKNIFLPPSQGELILPKRLVSRDAYITYPGSRVGRELRRRE